MARYTQGLGIDEPLAMSRSGATSYYEADGLGTITSLTSSAGALVQTYTFDSFGKQTASSGSLTNPFGYTAREFDSETSLYFYRARYYDPNPARFLSEDPLRFAGGYNFYAYVGNKSTGFRDPTGLLSTDDHYNLTYSAAMKAFGPKCEARARAIAQANRNQDALPGFTAKLKFLVYAADGWKKGSIHFGGPVNELLQNAFSSCDDDSLGKALHGLQDDMSHIGYYTDPWNHYWTSVFYWPFYSPADDPGKQLRNEISNDTGMILRQYARKCPGCCQ